MALDLTPVVIAEMSVERLNLPDDAVFSFKREDDQLGWVEVFALDQTSGSYDWDAVNVDNLAVAKDFTRVRIIDAEGLEALLYQCEACDYGGHRFKISRIDPPFGVTRIWTLRLERTERL